MNHTIRLALDRSVRSYDSDGRLRIATAVLTRAQVSPYLGAEIVDYQLLGLNPSKVYQVLRPASELQRALDGFNGLPILTRHEPVSASDYRGELVVGATGSNAALVNGEVANSLMIWASPGIQLIESGVARSLSCGYGYTPVVRSGSFEGVPYQIVMTAIQPNHLALVAEPRVAGAMVGDSMPKSFMKRNSRMGKDDELDDYKNSQKLDFGEIFANLTLYLQDILEPEQMEYVNSLLDGNVPDNARVLEATEQGAQDLGARRGTSGARALAGDHARAVRAQRVAMDASRRSSATLRGPGGYEDSMAMDLRHARERGAHFAMNQRSEEELLKMFPNANRLKLR